MGRFIDLTGQKFGRWTVLGRAQTPRFKSKEDNQAYWHCRCECGNEAVINGQSLRCGTSRSCGCLRRECSRERMMAANAAWREARK